jgi:thioredoxin-like negative regulator of GroEL
MSLRRKLVWTLPPALAVIALLAVSRASSAVPPQDADRPQPGARAQGGVPAMPPADVAAADRPAFASREAVEKFVRQKNEESARDRSAFTQAGWQFVQTTPPDPKLLAYDPSLLRGGEEELRFQISSTTARAADAANLAAVARDAQDPQTQIAAIDALGRIHDGGAQDQLLQLLDALPPASEARRQIAPLLHPADLNDPRAAKLALLLDSPSLDPVERKQIAFTLALVGLRDGTTLPSGLKLSQDSQRLIASMTQLASLRSP